MKIFRVVVNGSEYRVEIEELQQTSTSGPATSAPNPAPRPTAPVQPARQAPAKPAPASTPAPAGDGAINAPMPGTVLRVMVKLGEKVTKGQTLLVLEAMKMENEIQAPGDGTVAEINVSEGASVNAGQSLVVVSS
ncbi:biotin/lipoyl-containing protein [Desulforhopalus singaporensis]|uniref:Biotin carboxyl carrier protein n=1 Tax=Desulforhopalus singaporensis TaxID=91360 RepID=A0A1H0MKU7_9BACT|nr:biotin/lipoyl-containing protein [Desulforhopalus singaporensis]SDO80935.1 Biotin carboxyl carrier protein [Desulforhopalus singaporensis]